MVLQSHFRQVNARNRRRMGVLALAVLVLISCTCSTENLPDFITNLVNKDGTAQPTAPGDVTSGALLQDDFSNPASGWEAGEFDGGSVGYKDGVYFVIATQQASAMWGQAQQVFDDVVIEVDAIPVRAPANQNNDYGVMCRLQSSGDGYSMNISADGFFSIQIARQNEFTNLVDWTESSAIRTGNAANRIKAVCDGSKLALFVNGTLLTEVQDTTFTQGDIGLAATTYESDLTEVHFDNLIVRRP